MATKYSNSSNQMPTDLCWKNVFGNKYRIAFYCLEFLPLISTIAVEYYNSFTSWIRVISMDKFLSFNTCEYDPYMFCAPEEEERKVHTPYMEPQDYSLEFYPSFQPISSKI